MCKRLGVLACVLLFSMGSLLAKDYYVNPSSGKNSNSGSSASPWRTLAEVFKSGKRFQGGDTIYLARGYHGAVHITGRNSKDVFIKPIPGHSPAVRYIKMDHASNWNINGLTISKSTTPKDHPDKELSGGGILMSNMDAMSCNNNTIQNCSLYTLQISDNFGKHDWTNRKAGIIIFGTHNKIKGNHLYNGGGIQIGWKSNNTYVGYNVVENIGTDACGIRGSNCVIEYNLFMNSHKANGNHNDFIQGWGSSNNIVRNNELRAYTDPNQKYITDKQKSGGASTTHGMGLWDGMFRNWTIENNLIRIDHSAGIYVLGGRGLIIRNNRVVRCGKKIWRVRKDSAPGIKVAPSKRNEPSRDCIVTDNTAENFILDAARNKGESIGVVSNNKKSASYSPPADKIPPSKPTNLKTVTINGYGTDLRWSPSSDNKKVMGYHIYHNGVKIGKKRTGTHFLAVGYIGGNFQVQAFDYNRNVSLKSGSGGNDGSVDTPQVSAPPVDPTPGPDLTPPNTNDIGAQNLIGKRTSSTTITLQWTAPTGVEIKEYGIVLGANSKNWKRVKTVGGQTTSITLTASNGIHSGTALLQVRAITTNARKLKMSEQIAVLPYGETNSTDTGSTPPPPPPPPAPKPQQPVNTNGAHSLVGTRTKSQVIHLQWSAPANVQIKEYGVVLGANENVWRRIKTVDGQTTSVTLTSSNRINTGVALLQVRAITKAGVKLDMSPQLIVLPYRDSDSSSISSNSSNQLSVHPSPQTTTTVSTNGAHSLSAERTGRTTIELSWKAPAGVELKEYGVVLGSNNKVWKRVKTLDGNTTSTTLTSSNGIKTGVALLQVRAITKAGVKLDMSPQISVKPL